MVKTDETKAVAKTKPPAYPLLAKKDPKRFLTGVFTEMGVDLFSLNQIRVPAKGVNFWQVETAEGQTPEKTLDGFVLAAKHKQRRWYKQGYDETGGGSPPDCSSADGITGHGVNTLDEDAQPGSHDCATCPWVQFGSHRVTGRGQDCGQYATLVFLRAGCTLPDVIQIPATSLKGLQQFNLRLLNEDIDPRTVLVSLGLSEGPNSTVVDFTMKRAATDEEAELLPSLGEVVAQALLS